MSKKLSDYVKEFDTIEKNLESQKVSMTDEQNKVIEEVFEHFKVGGYGLLDAPSGAGKALRSSEKVLTPNGWIEIGLLKKGDKVIGSNGKATKVKGVYHQGIREIYRVTFKDNTTVECDKEHLWSVKESGKNKVVTLKELMKKELYTNRYDKRYDTIQKQYRYSIPTVTECSFGSDKDIKINPYLLGLLLGDGGLSTGTIRFTNSDIKIIEEMEKRLPSDVKIGQKFFIGGAWNISLVHKTKRTRHTHSLKKELDKLGLLYHKSIDKFIPSIYKNGTLHTRKEIIRGLIDTDGYVKDGLLKEYSTSSKMLANDFFEIAQSIGMKLGAIKERVPYFYYKGKRKKGHLNYRITERGKRIKFKTITNIEFSCRDHATCIEIDADDKLFVANGYNLTHNTTVIREIVKIAKLKGIKVHVTATTGKASSALKGKTIHSYLGLSMKENDNAVDYSDALKLTKSDGNSLSKPDILILDEFSMVGANLFREIKKSNFKYILFTGDSNQLPPVKEKKVEWFKECKYYYTLTKTLRAKDKDLVKLFKDFKDYKEEKISDLNLFDYVNDRNIVAIDFKDVDYIPTNSDSCFVGYRNKLVELMANHITTEEHNQYNLNKGVSITISRVEYSKNGEPKKNGNWIKRNFKDTIIYYNGEDVIVEKLHNLQSEIDTKGFGYYGDYKFSISKKGTGLNITNMTDNLADNYYINFPIDSVLKDSVLCRIGEYFTFLFNGDADILKNELDTIFKNNYPFIKYKKVFDKIKKGKELKEDILTLPKNVQEAYNIMDSKDLLQRAKAKDELIDRYENSEHKKRYTEGWAKFMSTSKVASARYSTARSIHKSQGISIPCIIIGDNSFFGASLSAQYVAVTRGKHGVILVQNMPDFREESEEI